MPEFELTSFGDFRKIPGRSPICYYTNGFSVETQTSPPNRDHVVQHFLQRARDTTWVYQVPLGEPSLLKFQKELGEGLMDMGIRNLHNGGGASVVVEEDVPTGPAESRNLGPQMARRNIEEKHAVVPGQSPRVCPWHEPTPEIRQELNPVVRGTRSPIQGHVGIRRQLHGRSPSLTLGFDASRNRGLASCIGQFPTGKSGRHDSDALPGRRVVGA